MQLLMVQSKLDFKRAYLRNPRFFIFSLLMPIGFYLLFTKVMMTGEMPASFAVQYMLSMTTYSLILSNVFTLSTLLADDQKEGVLDLIDLSPASRGYYYGAKLINIMLINGLSVLVIFITAAFSNQIVLDWTVWLQTAGWLWLASAPLCLIGLSISFLNDSNLIQLAANLISFPLAILSGLWWPISMLPKNVQWVGKHLPVYPINQIGQALGTGQSVAWGSYGVTMIWTLVLGGLVVYLSYHKRGVRA